MSIMMGLVALLAGLVLALLILRWRDGLADQAEWVRLLGLQPTKPAVFSPTMVEYLPEPARRFFNFAIRTGTPLRTVAEIDMTGQFSLGSSQQPKYRPMRAWQILAAPTGFLWRVQLPGAVPISGSDSASWTRFRLFGLLPVARMGGDTNHTRAAYGRYIAEALFWTPAALLPSEKVSWEAVSEDSARVIVCYRGLTQAVDIIVDEQGQPIDVQFMRWSNANAEKTHRLQPFGGRLRDFREVQGFRVPFSVEAGNMYGTPEQHIFFKAQVTAIRYP